MTSEHILELFESVPEKFLLESQDLRQSPSKSLKHHRPNTWLIAAAIAAALLLVGCVAVILGLKEYSIGTEAYTERFDNQGLAIQPTQKTKDILIFSGHSGEPAYEAQAEWIDYLNTLADSALLSEYEPVPDGITEVDGRTYGCSTQDMVQKLHSIAEKYGLKLLDVPVIFDHFAQDSYYLEVLGMESILRDGTPEQIQQITGFSLPPRNFLIDFFLHTENYTYPVTYVYQDKEYLPTAFSIQADLEKYNQWEYTTSSGEKLTLALNSSGHGIILADLPQRMICILVEGNRSNSHYPDTEEIISAKELEAIAEQFNFSVIPSATTSAEVSASIQNAKEAWSAENSYVPEELSEYADFLKKRIYFGYENNMYAFEDMNGDGTPDLLLLQEDGSIYVWLEQQDGRLVEHYNLSNSYLCENQIIESVRRMPVIRQEQHTYHRVTAALPEEESYGEIITVLNTSDGQWNVGSDPSTSMGEPISAEKARAIMAQYPHRELNQKPIVEFPIDQSGQTLGDYAETLNKPLSTEELHNVYRQKLEQEEYSEFSHYAIQDINGDGTEDLLLSRNGICCHMAMTYAYGKITNFLTGNFYICDDHKIDSLLYTADANGAEKVKHTFIHLDAGKQEALESLVYDKATASWQTDFAGTAMDQNKAESILQKYPHIELEFRPIH